MKKITIILALFLFMSSFVSATDFTTSIVGYFNMSSTSHNFDASGRLNNGSLFNGVTACATSPVGGAYNFSAAGDAYAKTLINNSEFPNAALSVSYLVKFVPSDLSAVSAGWIFGESNAGTTDIYNRIRIDDFLDANVDGSGGSDYGIGDRLVSAGVWYHVAMTWKSGGKLIIYQNGKVTKNLSASTGNLDTYRYIYLGATNNQGTASSGIYGCLDEVGFWNRSLIFSEVQTLNTSLHSGSTYPFFALTDAPVISSINCTACNSGVGDSVVPYSTSDTTPTFNFSTNINANCRLDDSNLNFTAMGVSAACGSGEGAKSHVCTLGLTNELATAVDYVYVACKSNYSSAFNKTTLLMNVTGLNDNVKSKISSGVGDSLSGATVRSSQKVYLKNASNVHKYATADRLALYQNKRWIFNYRYDSEPSLGFMNITPAVYFLEISNITQPYTVRSRVSAFINNTVS